MKTHILNLGAGVQSTALYLMSLDGEVQKFDAAIFADTQEEPEDVYRHLEWMESLVFLIHPGLRPRRFWQEQRRRTEAMHERVQG
ncbi:MAG: hypothetical protein EBR82_68020 [Caulobacteraceae bacterium]|nr:hypothetical protein [Caulobacteraceae bacterium]